MKRISLIASVLIVAGALVAPAMAQMPPQDHPGGGEATRSQAGGFDRFLDTHPEAAAQVRKDPALINDPKFLSKHPELAEFLSKHPHIREHLKNHPRRFLARERWRERHERRGEGRELYDKDSESRLSQRKELHERPEQHENAGQHESPAN